MLINWLIAHVIGGLLAKALILYAYYALIRKVIQWFAFPGSLHWSQRTVEYQQCQSVAQRLHSDCEGYRNTITYLLMQNEGPLSE